MTLTFTVPGKPTAKARPRVTAHGTYTPKRTWLAEQHVLYRFHEECGTGNPITCPLTMHIEAVFEVPASWSKKRRAAAFGTAHVSRPDADNIAKLVTDALNGALYADDAQIHTLTARKRYADQDECAGIHVRAEWEDQ